METLYVLAGKLWQLLQKNEVTLRFTLWLRSHGINRRIKRWLVVRRDAALRKAPPAWLRESAAFFEANRDRCEAFLALLQDEKSKRVWGGCVAYRAARIPLKPELYSEKDQYFVRDILRVEDDEVFVDCGAYTGDTIKQFFNEAEQNGAQYKRIVALEPDTKNFTLMQKLYGKNPKVVLIKKGVSDAEKDIYFREDGAQTKIVETEAEATARLPVINIDAIPECRDATWIKMDIEGAEMDALRGAKQTILRNKPKLTICIYHSNEDMLRIGEWIHALVPEYRLYVRQHTATVNETVLYAVL